VKKYKIEIGASNTIHKYANSRRGIIRCLSRCQGRVSVLDTHTGREVYFGAPEQIISIIKIDLENEY
jgi:hypothetical protein